MATNPPVDVNAALNSMLTLVRSAAADYIKGNSAAATSLGEEFGTDLLSAIFNSSLIMELNALTPLVAGASADQIADFEELVATRDEQIALVDAAEQKNASTVAALKSNAITAVKGVIGSALGIIAGVALKAIAGSSTSLG